MQAMHKYCIWIWTKLTGSLLSQGVIVWWMRLALINYIIKHVILKYDGCNKKPYGIMTSEVMFELRSKV